MRESDFQGIPNFNAAHQGPLTVGAAAAALTGLATLHADTKVVLIAVETAAVRYTVNGTTPTSTLGFAALAGQFIRLTRQEADAAKFIRSTGSDAALQVAQYKD
jgi:hypothetical protein